jgi:hypothetical protein
MRLHTSSCPSSVRSSLSTTKLTHTYLAHLHIGTAYAPAWGNLTPWCRTCGDTLTRSSNSHAIRAPASTKSSNQHNMCSPRPDRLGDSAFEDLSPDDTFPNVSPRANEPSCGCNCACTDKNDKSRNSSVLPTPNRGRSLTPKHDRTNGAADPVEARPTPGGIDSPSYNATSSVNGQEGLQDHQTERPIPTGVDDIAAYANESIQRWLTEHDPEHPYRFSGSADPSMRVEASTVAPSSASSGFLPSRTATSDELTTFTYGGFDEPKPQTCAFTPLWLTHELRYCRNFPRGGAVASGSGYPAMIDVDDL